MTLSMTGFSRQEIAEDWGSLSIEIKSVNHRYLETWFRLPESLKSSETQIRDQIRKTIKRGKLDIQVRLTTTSGRSESIQVNDAALHNLDQALEQVRHIVPEAKQPTALELLSWPGITQSAELDVETLNAVLKTLTANAIKQLVEHRRREGVELAQAIEERLIAISNIVAEVKNSLPNILQQQRQNLADKVADLRVEIDPQRLEQEIVLLAQKADVAEELDRLNAHIQEARHILKKKEVKGRQLDFLMQEFNREANTLSSKSIVTETTRSAVELKVLIEQMREQIQNIE